MTRDEIVKMLATVERTLDQRVEVWREVLEPDGTVIARVYSGSFQRTPDSYGGKKP